MPLKQSTITEVLLNACTPPPHTHRGKHPSTPTHQTNPHPSFHPPTHTQTHKAHLWKFDLFLQWPCSALHCFQQSVDRSAPSAAWSWCAHSAARCGTESASSPARQFLPAAGCFLPAVLHFLPVVSASSPVAVSAPVAQWTPSCQLRNGLNRRFHTTHLLEPLCMLMTTFRSVCVLFI